MQRTIHMKVENTLERKRPSLMDEWDYQKNMDIDPASVSYGSTKKAWWKCHICGYEWQAQINNRAKELRPSGCPACAKRKRIETYMCTKLDCGKNSLSMMDPELAAQWDMENNGSVTPDDVSVNTKKKYWWICPKCGYRWKASPGCRHNHRGCPVCDGHKVVWSGHNDLASQKQELLEDWDYSKNIDIDPTKVRVYSQKKAWWKCHICGYEWYTSISNRSSGTGCAYCAGQVAIEGKNDLATTNPEIAAEWNYERNGNLIPSQFKAGSDKKLWWKCSKCGNEWKAAIKTRKIAGCPACAGRLRSRYNDVATLRPVLLADWDYNKNGDLAPDRIAAGSHHKVWWNCHVCGYQWQSVVKTRTKGVGCPRCSGRIVWKGHNDLATKCPEILKEWDYDKNFEQPDEVSFRSSKKLWWKCPICGNSYKMSADSKIDGYGCPKCNRVYHTSFPEQAIYYYLKKSGIEVENGYRAKWLGKSEIDIYIAPLKLAIEYDGQVWHSDLSRDRQKSQLIISQGINLVRVREPGCPDLADDRIKTFITNEYNGDASYINVALKALFRYINETYFTRISETVNVVEDHIAITASYENQKQSKSLSANYPELESEWDYEKNCGLTPEQVTTNSHLQVWWRCHNCGFNWQASVNSRTKGQGCPACSHTVVHQGVTDLATIDPRLAAEWNYEKNDGLKPEEFFPNSSRNVWWKCLKCGYEWEKSILNRHNGSSCPACSNRVLVKGRNDLESRCPTIVKDWSYNDNLQRPEEMLFTSASVVWWMCHTCGYKWRASIYARSIKSQPCPYCSGRAVWTGKNDFATMEPELMKDWDYRKNTSVNPSKLSQTSRQKVAWKCHKCGYEWIATPNRRVDSRSCPICGKGSNNNRTVRHSLAEKKPEVVIFWDFDKNEGLLPNDVSYGSNTKIWCKCPVCGCQWKSTVKQLSKDCCPECRKISTSKAISNAAIRKNGALFDLFPAIAEQWDYNKNGGLTTHDVSPSSARKVWWKCHTCGYEWVASINSRTSNHTGCPYCAGKIVWKGRNDLATTNPELLSEWNYEKNTSISPDEVSIGSHKKVWWRCHKCGYEWETKVEVRKKGSGCPACGNKVLWSGYNDLATKFPKIAAQWDYEANDTIPEHVTSGSTKKYMWICSECGYHWVASISSRTAGHGCPKCARILAGKKLRAKQRENN